MAANSTTRAKIICICMAFKVGVFFLRPRHKGFQPLLVDKIAY